MSGLPLAAQRRLQKERKSALVSQLSALPAPQNEYTIVMPELPADEEEDDEPAYEEDALDTAAREDAERARLYAEELAKRSSALQAELPRPLVVNRDMAAQATAEGAADQLVREEMIKMLEADASAFPVKGAPEVKKKKPLKQLPAELLAAAKEMLAAEVEALQQAVPPPSAAELEAAMEEVSTELAYVPSLQKFGLLSQASKAERLQVPQQQLQLVKNFMARDAKKAAKIEKKLDVLLGGYKKRASALAADLQEKQQLVRDKDIELNCFKQLQGHEAIALPQRLSEMQALVGEQTAREAELQAKYAELERMRLTLREQLAAKAR